MTDYPPPPPGNYPPPPPGDYPPPPPGNYPPPPPGNYPPPPPGGMGYPPGYGVVPHGVGQLPQRVYTPWTSRVAAVLVDNVPVAVAVGVAYAIAFDTGENFCTAAPDGYGGECTSAFSAVGVLAVVVAWLASLAYGIWNYGYRQGTIGSSIGKSTLKFKVVSITTGQPIGFGLSIIRQLAHIIDGLICYIGYLFPLWDAKRQTLADKIMSTVCLPTD
ncbi:MAG TPA: RDD family protein [Mycobacterium sp.]